MGRCFVIQPFDGGAFDKRFDDVFRPAIEAAELEPYRVDRDPQATVPITSIEDGINAADICFAEVSTDNPNVWYELGFAFASGKQVVMASIAERARYPFDIQHRHVVRYRTDAPSDFNSLRDEITLRLKAALSLRRETAEVARLPITQPQNGLTPEQLAALVVVARTTGIAGDGMAAHQVSSEMESAGFTAIATTLGLRSLMRLGLVETFTEEDHNGYGFLAFRSTDAGVEWLEDNKDLLMLRVEG